VRREWFWLVPFLLLAHSCKTKDDVRREKELERLKSEFKDVQADRADYATLSEEIKLDLSRMKAQFEEMSEYQRRESENIRKDLSALSTRIQTLEERKHETVAPLETPREPKRKVGFDVGRDLFEQGKYEEAIDVFKQVLRNKPRPEEAKKAQYWLAESYFFSKDYASAALEYSSFKKRYPNDSLLPNATYRQANCFRNMGKAKEAALFYQELLEKYPKHSLTTRAKLEVKRLKRGVSSDEEEKTIAPAPDPET